MTRKDATPELRRGKWKRRFLVASSSIAVVTVCVLIRAIGGREQAGAQSPTGRSTINLGSRSANATSSGSGPTAHSSAPAPGNPGATQDANATSSQQQTVAVVNSEEIHRQELAQQCLSQYGKEVLETVMNKYLILTYCEKQGIKISKQDVDEEIARMAKQFSIPVDQWLQMLKQERGIKPEQYADDIIMPTLALRKLAASRIEPTEQELDDAFEAEYGTAVKARLIVLDKADKARDVQARAAANPADFEMLARKYSIDSNSASVGGLIQPIRKHIGDPQVEATAFKMKEGEVSPVIEVHNQFVILKCEGQTAPSGFQKEQVMARLKEFVRDRKLRSVASEVFKKLQNESQVVNVYNDPQKRTQMPGVAATINGKAITIRELAEACIDRHGDQVLEVMIHRKLLEQELKRKHINVTQQELDAEIGRAAVSAGKLKTDGKPDVDAWLKMITDGGLTMDKYMHDAVWPSTALKLIVGDVKVTDDDIDRGYDANYGKKAQVRAIVLDTQRRAQEVWQKARDNPSVDFFGKLAEQYSIEPASRANEGRVPPIRRYGGQPDLEREAFNLKPGEISGIVQVTDKFVILYLEDFTKPVQVRKDEVKSLIYEDVHEKKLRLKMSSEFDRLKDEANIDNYLAGTSHSPQRNEAKAGARGSGISSTGPASPDKLGLTGPGGRSITDDATVPAAYETTGLMPRTPPTTQTASPSNSRSNSGSPPDSDQPRSGSVYNSSGTTR
ncbi:MAG TPA: peptidylprolyl isomerase [Pirellulales bacterium]|jgi:parvulin-like peptidyl-prolyl isomerase|nr:peptidylprolyl isomerase [Pirellulales bacterium]